MLTVELKHCPICSNDLPVSEFGICRARKDGKNLYCKSCIREKVTASRRALKDYKEARKKYAAQQIQLIDFDYESGSVQPLSKLSPVQRVKDAIARGFRTQAEIGRETRLGKDDVGDAIANLLLWTREIKTKVVEGTRLYFLNEVEEKPHPVYETAIPFAELSRKSNQLFVQGERRVWSVA